ncbi:MAG: hypothetical protein JJE28_03225 [Actinomycetales bacterium]|nr:hypothetical protein [Actinomycetales bacterium]
MRTLRSALAAGLDASLAKELETGITEQHTIGDKKFILVYDPTATIGKQVAGMDATQSVAVYDTPDALSLNKMKAYLDSVGDSLGTVAYNGTSFTIDNSHFTIILMVKDDLIEGSAITAGGSATPQLVASTYSLSDIAKKILQGAATSTPAPASTAAPAQ